MINYFLGYILGILTVLVFLILDIYNNTRGLRRKDLATQIEERIKPRKGTIFPPEGEEEIAREKIIEQNEKKGIDTKLEEIE